MERLFCILYSAGKQAEYGISVNSLNITLINKKR